MMRKIVQKNESVLRKTSQEVPIDSICSPKIQKIIEKMEEALASQEDGVALSAIQIGYPLRIFIISKKIFEINKRIQKNSDEINSAKDLVFINPVLKKISKEKEAVEEGCLSVRYLYGKVNRANKATIQAYDEKGRKFERGGTSLMAQIFQHEIDHMNGVLFIDKAKYVEEILPEETNKTKSDGK